ncbi:MAG TPA: hypothetical protein VF168_08410 [Trueperaceae bacterium]
MAPDRLLTSLLAFAALLAALAVYALDRPETVLIGALTMIVPTLPTLELPLSGVLPSALHAFGLALLARLLRPGLAPYAAALSATVVALLLESAQLLGPPGLAPGRTPLSGTFDPADLLMCLVGGSAAFVALYLTSWRSPSERHRRTAMEPVRWLPLIVAATASSVATTPTGLPPGWLSADLTRLCPGSPTLLSWSTSAQHELFLVASDPAAITPGFERLPVEPSGELQVAIHGDVEFQLQGPHGLPPGGESEHSYAFTASVRSIPTGGEDLVLYAEAGCAGGRITWDPVLVSALEHDDHTVVSGVSSMDPGFGEPVPGDLVVGHALIEQRLAPSSSTAVFDGTPLVGAWSIVPSQPLGDGYCPLESASQMPVAAIRVHYVCPGGTGAQQLRQ